MESLLSLNCSFSSATVRGELPKQQHPPEDMTKLKSDGIFKIDYAHHVVLWIGRMVDGGVVCERCVRQQPKVVAHQTLVPVILVVVFCYVFAPKCVLKSCHF